jgi:CheY-like chemotaxis protein
MNQGSSTFQGTNSPAGATNLTSKGVLQRQVNDSVTTNLLPAILVVDDDPSVLEMLHDALDFWGFDVFLAKNGHEGLKVLARQKVDGILLDMDMPLMNGLTMLNELRRLGYPMPVVIMSGALKKPDVSQLSKESAQGFMSKPFSLPFLRDVCMTIFENQGVDGRSADHFPVT